MNQEPRPVEWGPRGIRTCAIVPGLFPTEGAWSR